MRHILVLTAASALAIGLVPAAHATQTASVAATPAAAACIDAAPLAFDVANAARVPIVVGKAKKPRPAGPARAQALANSLADENAPSVCTMPVAEWEQSLLDEIQTYFEAGDTQTALDYLSGAIEGISVPEADATALRQKPRLADACSGFGLSDFDLPSDVPFALALGAKAELLGNDDLAAQALDKARAVMKQFAESGAGGQAQTIGDWLRLAAQLQLLGGDESTSESMFAKAREVAKRSYDEYNRSRCRHTKQTVNCYFKAAMAMMLLGVEPEPSQKDMGEAAAAAAALNLGRRPLGCVETYSFRWRSSIELDNGDYLTMDTGPVTFDAEFGKITSEDRGPLTLSNATNVPCWQADDDADDGWAQVGSANVTGGSFPYQVGGTDLDGTLRIRLLQSAAWKVTGSGDLGCQMLIAIFDGLLEAFPQALNQGIEVPAGVKSYGYDEVTHWVHAPTGKTLTARDYFSLKLLKSTTVKR